MASNRSEGRIHFYHEATPQEGRFPILEHDLEQEFRDSQKNIDDEDDAEEFDVIRLKSEQRESTERDLSSFDQGTILN